MTILFTGGEMGAFIASGGGVAEDASGEYNSSFARCSMACDGLAGDPDIYYAETASWSAQTGDFYLHFENATSGYAAPSAQNWVVLADGTGTAIFRITQNPASANTTELQLQYWNSGAAWANAGTTVLIGSTRTNYDLFVNCTTGVMQFYVAGSLQKNVTGLSLSHLTGPTKAQLYSEVGTMHWSQVIAANVSTVGKRLMTRYAVGAGANTSWTGTYTEIDETVYADADLISAASTSLVETFTQTGPSLPSGYVVSAVAVAIRGKTSGGVNNVKGVLRVGSTNYSSSSIALSGGYTAQVAIWETNPATSAAWANADISSLQFGVESA